MWVPFNEGWGQWDTAAHRRADQEARSDPAGQQRQRLDRPRRGRRQRHAQVSRPGRRPSRRRTAPRCSASSAAWACRCSGHTWQDEKNWGYRSFTDAEALTDAYVDLIAKLLPAH